MEASSPALAMLPGIGLLGAGSCTIFSQRRQDFFSRAIWRTFSCAMTMSSISLTSSSTSRRSQPQVAAAVGAASAGIEFAALAWDAFRHAGAATRLALGWVFAISLALRA